MCMMSTEDLEKICTESKCKCGSKNFREELGNTCWLLICNECNEVVDTYDFPDEG